MASKKKSDYGADSIVVLEGLEPVRKRPAMYIGTTAQYGVNHCLNEIIDNTRTVVGELSNNEYIEIIFPENCSINEAITVLKSYPEYFKITEQVL